VTHGIEILESEGVDDREDIVGEPGPCEVTAQRRRGVTVAPQVGRVGVMASEVIANGCHT
jgi:hypothetical protein